MTEVFAFVEGQTERTFVRDVLAPHLVPRAVYLKSTLVGHQRPLRGGVAKFSEMERDLVAWMKRDRRPDIRFTTMIDYYRYPSDAPGMDRIESIRAPADRVRLLEEALAKRIREATSGDSRFIPYLQLHEFEALLFTDVEEMADWFGSGQGVVRKLAGMVQACGSPEAIDDGVNTAPSKRILTLFPQFAKASDGPLIAESIGLAAIRAQCPHFDDWVSELESLGTAVHA